MVLLILLTLKHRFSSGLPSTHYVVKDGLDLQSSCLHFLSARIIGVPPVLTRSLHSDTIELHETLKEQNWHTHLDLQHN